MSLVDRLLFEIGHNYSNSADAAAKRAIDVGIAGGDFAKGGSVAIDNEGYVKALVGASSRGKTTVSGHARGLQFFIVEGGGEGFLPDFYLGKDASRVVSAGDTTAGGSGTTMVFDDNDLLAVFDSAGKLIAAALLRRPLSITHPDIWTEHTANRVYHAWDGQPVSLYRNVNFEIKYFGLVVHDSLGMYRSGKVRIDLHKEEDTNGCIFIRDPDTPDTAHPGALSTFEPKLIKAVQAAVGATTKSFIGTMHMTSVR